MSLHEFEWFGSALVVGGEGELGFVVGVVELVGAVGTHGDAREVSNTL